MNLYLLSHWVQWDLDLSPPAWQNKITQKNRQQNQVKCRFSTYHSPALPLALPSPSPSPSPSHSLSPSDSLTFPFPHLPILAHLFTAKYFFQKKKSSSLLSLVYVNVFSKKKLPSFKCCCDCLNRQWQFQTTSSNFFVNKLQLKLQTKWQNPWNNIFC